MPRAEAEVNSALHECWEYIPAIVRPYFVKRVAILGPESSGKTSLAAALADEFRTAWVPEFGRDYCDARNALSLTLADFEAIGRGQVVREEERAREANRILVCDTDLITTCTWSDLVVGKRSEWLESAAAAQHYDLTLVLSDAGAPWVDDGTRVFEARRAEHLQRLVTELTRCGRRFQLLDGNWAERHDRPRVLVRELWDLPGACGLRALPG